MKKKNALSPRKDYFAKLYNSRSSVNKWLLHIYVLVCTLPPIYIALLQNSTRLQSVGIFIFLGIIWYIYGFAIKKFPKDTYHASVLLANIIGYTIYVFFTLGSKSVLQTLYFDGMILLCGIILGNIFMILRTAKVDNTPKNIYTTGLTISISLLVIFLGIVFVTIQEIVILLQTNTDGAFYWWYIVSAIIGLVWSTYIHAKYFLDSTHSLYWNTKNEEQTRAVGRYIGRWILRGGMILTLNGNLGAGKTTLVKGIAEELGITDHITSPTFSLMNIYPIPEPKKDMQKLIHVDTYRLETTEDLVDIGIEEYLGEKNTVCIVEWPEKIAPLLTQKNVLHITIEQTSGDTRIISMNP